MTSAKLWLYNYCFLFSEGKWTWPLNEWFLFFFLLCLFLSSWETKTRQREKTCQCSLHAWQPTKLLFYISLNNVFTKWIKWYIFIKEFSWVVSLSHTYIHTHSGYNGTQLSEGCRIVQSVPLKGVYFRNVASKCCPINIPWLKEQKIIKHRAWCKHYLPWWEPWGPNLSLFPLNTQCPSIEEIFALHLVTDSRNQ